MAFAKVDADGRIQAWCAEDMGLDGFVEFGNGDYVDATMGGGRRLSDYRVVGSTAVYDPPEAADLDAGGVAALVLAALAEGVRQDGPPGERARPGLRWARRYDAGCTAVVWEEVEEPGAPGTDANPIAWRPGCDCWANYRYTDGSGVWVCVEDGAWGALDVEHFEEVR